MLDFLPVYKREIKTYFQSASTYVVLALFFLLTGWIYFRSMQQFSELSIQSMQGSMFGQQQQAPNVTEFIISMIFQILTSLIMFTLPILSMRLLAEEKNKGTFELLVSCPIGDWSILMGKYLALCSVGVLILLISVSYPVLTWWAGRANHVGPEWPVVFSCAIGLLLMFCTYASFGLMASALSDNQMVAAVVTLIGLIIWQIVGALVQTNIGWVDAAIRELSANAHATSFTDGVISLKDVAYYFLMSFFFLFIASKTLDARRWRV